MAEVWRLRWFGFEGEPGLGELGTSRLGADDEWVAVSLGGGLG
jgi:hypothetical protein